MAEESLPDNVDLLTLHAEYRALVARVQDLESRFGGGPVIGMEAWRAFGTGRTKYDGTGIQMLADDTLDGATIVFAPEFELDPIHDPTTLPAGLIRTFILEAPVGTQSITEMYLVATHDFADYIDNSKDDPHGYILIRASSGAGTTTVSARRNGSSADVKAATLEVTAGAHTVQLSGTAQSISMDGAFMLNPRLTPALIEANQNNYAPTDIRRAVCLRLSSDASRDITGIVAAVDGGSVALRGGRLLFIFNVGSFNIVLKNEDANSEAENRFALKGDITIAPAGGTALYYDETTDRWRCYGVY